MKMQIGDTSTLACFSKGMGHRPSGSDTEEFPGVSKR
jgi:hypothetical protein